MLPGLDTGTEAKLFKVKIRAYQPDIVLIGYFLNDAVADAAIEEEVSFYQKFKSHSYLQDIYDAVLGKWLLDNSYFYNFVIIQLNSLRSNAFEKSYLTTIKSNFASKENLSYHADELAFLFSEIRKANAAPILVILPFMFELDNYPFNEAHQFLREVATGQGVRYIDLLENFRGKDAASYSIGRYDTHLNEAGASLVAAAVGNFILTMNGTAE